MTREKLKSYMEIFFHPLNCVTHDEIQEKKIENFIMWCLFNRSTYIYTPVSALSLTPYFLLCCYMCVVRRQIPEKDRFDKVLCLCVYVKIYLGNTLGQMFILL